MATRRPTSIWGVTRIVCAPTTSSRSGDAATESSRAWKKRAFGPSGKRQHELVRSNADADPRAGRIAQVEVIAIGTVQRRNRRGDLILRGIDTNLGVVPGAVPHTGFKLDH
jgi:hypothetical protein